MKRKLRPIIAIITLVFMLPLTVLPSSATPPSISNYKGEDAIGAFNMDIDTPVVLEKMALTYNVSEFPERFSSDPFPAEKSNLSVKYSLYNPTESDATVTVAFPMMKSTYSHANISISDYGFKLDNDTAKTVIRHTYHEGDRHFDHHDDPQRLQDDYLEHSIFNKDAQVTKYTYKISDVDTLAHPDAYFTFTMLKGERRVLVDASGKGSSRDGIYTLSGEIGSLNDGTVDVYVFGNQPLALPSFKFYEDEFLKDGEEIEGKAELISKTSVDFLEFVYNYYDADKEISEVDWYNIAVSRMSASTPCVTPFEELFGYDSLYENYILSWYYADIPFAPGERIEFEVSMPIVPDEYITTNPHYYQYYFLDCMDITRVDGYVIDIEINTDFYLIDYIDLGTEVTNPDNFTKAETGYKISIDDITDQTFFCFSLCEVENPEQDFSDANATLAAILLIIIGSIIGFLIKILTLPFVILAKIISGIISLFAFLYQWIIGLF